MQLYLEKKKYRTFIFIFSVLCLGIPYVLFSYLWIDVDQKNLTWLVPTICSIQFIYVVTKLFQLLNLNTERPVIYVDNGYLFATSTSLFNISGLDINSIVSISEGRTYRNVTTYKLTLNKNLSNENLLDWLINRKPKITDSLVNSNDLEQFIKQLREEISKSPIDLL